jgi:superfamily II DNA/RNA helicase
VTSSSLVPPHVRFSDLGIPRSLSAALEQQGICSPLPIQAETLPDCLAGHDVCGKAPTGSGKTLAFGLAVLSRLAFQPAAARRSRRHPSALVLAPTRELAAQIEEVLRPLAKAIGARTGSVYGGVSYGKQLAALAKGLDVLIACPGRLADLVERGSVDLSQVGIVVVDEADRMADMGFLPVVRRLVEMTSASRQTLLFSATLDGTVERLVRDYQAHPRHHEVKPAGLGEVEHHFWRVEERDRAAVTAQTVTTKGPAIVFCRTKRGADRLSGRLGLWGLRAAAIHGNRSQSQRERALAEFRAGRLDVLVATDVAARGIHVEAVPLVVHFDPPADPTGYVHRSGRTGRAGASGTVVSLLGADQVEGARLVQKTLGLSGAISSPDIVPLAAVGSERGSRAARPEEPAAAVPPLRRSRSVRAHPSNAAAHQRAAGRPQSQQGRR